MMISPLCCTSALPFNATMIDSRVVLDTPAAAGAVPLAARAALAPSSTIRDLLAVTQQPGMRSLGGGLPAAESFPVARLRAAADAVLSDPDSMVDALQYGPTDGLPRLRELLANEGRLHGLTRAAADELVITTGSQQALDLLCRTMIDPGDEIGVDDPCYLGARQVFVAGGARLRGIPVDADGLRTDLLDRWLREGWRPRLVYTVSNFQNPTGATLSIERRIHLVALAAEFHFLVIDDDPYYALNFRADETDAMGRESAQRSLGDLDPEHVASLGSLSKVLSPGMRVGWVRAPHWLRDSLIRAKQACDLHAPSLSQAIAFEVLNDEEFLRGHLQENRDRYARRAAALSAVLTPFASFSTPTGGMFVWIELPGIDTTTLLEFALRERVVFIPGPAFSVEKSWRSFARLSFASLSEPELRDAGTSVFAAVLALRDNQAVRGR